MTVLPTSDILSELFAGDPAFKVLPDGSIASVEDLPPLSILGHEKYKMVSILRSAPSHMMERNELLEACVDEGINLHTAHIPDRGGSFPARRAVHGG
jgi:hypothetical protein